MKFEDIKTTYHSHKHSVAQLWKPQSKFSSGPVRYRDTGLCISSPCHSLHVNVTACRCMERNLTEFTMSLRAWKPDTTGKTCSLPSAISASCGQSGNSKRLLIQKAFQISVLMSFCFSGRFLACAWAFREAKSATRRLKLWGAGWSFHLLL